MAWAIPATPLPPPMADIKVYRLYILQQTVMHADAGQHTDDNAIKLAMQTELVATMPMSSVGDSVAEYGPPSVCNGELKTPVKSNTLPSFVKRAIKTRGGETLGYVAITSER